jgi:integrase
MSLTDRTIRNLKPKAKPYKKPAGDALYLLITPSGGKLWRMNYRYAGKQKTLALGSYPLISLLEAREKIMAEKKLLKNGIDPGQQKKAQKQTRTEIDSFEAVAREWYEKQKKTWSKSYADRTIARLEYNIFPYIGKRPINDIKVQELVKVLKLIEDRGAYESAHRIRALCSEIFRYAIANGFEIRNIAADVKGALTPTTVKHRAAIIEPDKFAGMLRAIEGYQGSPIVRSALLLQALTFVRPGELRHMEWAEINFEEAIWSIPAIKMKMRQPHLVPLSNQAISILKDLQPRTGKSIYVFPSHRGLSRPMSENAVLVALRAMGYSKEDMTGHGFRASARSLLHQYLKQKPEWIEAQLAHAKPGSLRGAYDRTTHIEDRMRMMQLWSDYCDGLKSVVRSA